MPHFIIECSENIFSIKSPEEIMQAVYEEAEASGLFKGGDIKIRIKSYSTYKLANGKKDFLHIFAHIMEGRSIEQRENLSGRVIYRLNELFPDISILSMNIYEFELATYTNKAIIHPQNKSGDRHFRDK